MSFIKRVLGDPNERELKRLRPTVVQINSLEEEIAALSDEDLRARTAEFREQLSQCEDQDEQDDLLDDFMPEAFAMVREASQRTLGLRHYDVQMIGGIVLHQGKVAEMRTGEGKTLVSTLPAYLNALTGRGVHIVTPNDYLAKRDAESMGRIHRLLGLSVGCILSGPENQDPNGKRAGYMSDITYATNNELGFDYLRDNMVPDINSCVQRQLNYAIVDEVDNILIDEARTPLIISAPSMESAEMYVRFARVMPIIKEGDDFEVDLKSRTVALNDGGIDKIEAALGVKNIYGDMDLTRYLENALKAHAIMQRDRDYIVVDGEVIIIDEHTGRQMIGRRYNEGLHQAIEAKEHVKVQAENRTVATITFQNYFRLYRKLAGMTGTALTEAQELDKIYKLDVIAIPTHKTMVRRDETDYIYKSEDAKFNAVVEEIRTRHDRGQPVLVGTTSVDLSEKLATKLDRTGIDYEILNAKNHLREAAIIAQAGRIGAVTISTNMAGRGTDILLGGNPDGLVDAILAEMDIDRDIATDEDRAEALAEAKRRCDTDHAQVVALGGLHVIGTERHDSRRIDNQLRGRAGRQGDPGSSRFYVSLQDDLMRRFGSDRVAGMMDRLGMEEDMPIESGLAARMIEQAQTKVEAYYFDIRKNIVEYDDVIAKQREVIYADRRNILEGVDVHERVTESIAEEVEAVVRAQTTANLPENWNFEAIDEFFDHWNISLPEDFFPEQINQLKRDPLVQSCIDWALESYNQRRDRLDEQIETLGITDTSGVVIMQGIERSIMLRVIDVLWMEHIDSIDVLRSGIGLRSIAQKDPLVEFKNEAYAAFDHLKAQIQHFVAENAMLTQVTLQLPPPVSATPPPQMMQTNTEAIAAATGQSKSESGVTTLARPDETKVAKEPKRTLTQTKAIKRATNGHNKPSSGSPSRPLVATANGASAARPPQVPAATTPVGAKAIPSTKTPSRPLTIPKATVVKSSPINGTAPVPKVGPNDPCPCGSKQKYKFCHGLAKK